MPQWTYVTIYLEAETPRAQQNELRKQNKTLKTQIAKRDKLPTK